MFAYFAIKTISADKVFCLSWLLAKNELHGITHEDIQGTQVHKYTCDENNLPDKKVKMTSIHIKHLLGNRWQIEVRAKTNVTNVSSADPARPTRITSFTKSEEIKNNYTRKTPISLQKCSSRCYVFF